jgi:hypothetical protein
MKTRLAVFIVLALIASLFAVEVRASQDVRNTLSAWCVNQMAAWSPPGSFAVPDAKELPEESLVRYDEIAKDAIDTVYDSKESPIFKGKHARAQTLGVLLSTLHSESTFRKDVDFGIGDKARGDGGRSWCLAQIRLSIPKKDGKTKIRILIDSPFYGYNTDGSAGLGGEDLVRDRKACLRVALHMIRGSFYACSRYPVEARLSSYVRRDCIRGQEISRSRMKRVSKWFKHNPPPFEDLEVLGAMEPTSPDTLALAN